MLYYCDFKHAELNKGLQDILHAVLSISGLWSFLFLPGVNVFLHSTLKEFLVSLPLSSQF